MSTATARETWIGRPLVDGDDRRIGTVEETYCNKETGEPLWMVVRSGRLRTKRRLVPLAGATVYGEVVRTPRMKPEIDAAPDVDLGNQLTDEAVRELYRYYGMRLDPSATSDPVAPDDEVRVADRILRYLD